MNEWDAFDQTQANLEGWGIFECDGSENGPYQLCRLDEEEVFPSDDEAWTHVSHRAQHGSVYHHYALDLIGRLNPLERECIKKFTGY